MDQQNPFKWRHFQAGIILLCVRWYLRYPLSFRDLEARLRAHRVPPSVFATSPPFDILAISSTKKRYVVRLSSVRF